MPIRREINSARQVLGSANCRYQISPKQSACVESFSQRAWYWGGLPYRWLRGAMRNNRDIIRVLNLTRFNTLPAGLVSLDHPWVTGIEPETGQPIWPMNIVFQTPRAGDLQETISDAEILSATGHFLANRVRQSAITPEIPQGPRRRMPHAVNYMHGSSHYNSGIFLLNNLAEGYRYFTHPDFRRELKRFVSSEHREVLIVFRDRNYSTREYARFSCCLRLLYSWFCNPNGPQGNVLWGNFGPFPAANLITGAWAHDLRQLSNPETAATVARPPIEQGQYFQQMEDCQGRTTAKWPERILARIMHQRVRLRGSRGGLRFVDRREVYADQIKRRLQRGEPDQPLAEWS